MPGPSKAPRRSRTGRRAATGRSRHASRRAGSSRFADQHCGDTGARPRSGGVSQPFWSRLERGLITSVSIETLASCAAAVGGQLAGFIEAHPGNDLRATSSACGAGFGRVPCAWRRLVRPAPGSRDDPERRLVTIDRRAPDSLRRAGGRRRRGSRAAFGRGRGDARPDRQGCGRTSDSPPEARVAGLLVLRATLRNRATTRELASVFSARFPGPPALWLAALRTVKVAMPEEDGLLWSSVSGDRLMAVRRRGS